MKAKVTFRKVRAEGSAEVIGTEPVYWLDGKEVTEAEFKALIPDKPGLPMMSGIAHGCWPQKSKGFAVHRRQVKEANERNARLGLSTRYEADGTAIIPDRAERARLCRAEGFYDNDAGYGDAAPIGPKAYGVEDDDCGPDIDLSVAIGEPA